MLLSRMHEVDRLIEQQAGLDAMLGWENNVAAITGLSKTAADTWGVCYVPVAVQPDGEALHISHCMEGWSLQMIARAVFMATAALLYDACLADGPDTLSKLASGIMSAVDPDQTPMGCGVQVAPANNVRCNWLPFTLAEASHLAFGDRVSVDALPAVLCALRMQQPDFNLPLHTEAVVLA